MRSSYFDLDVGRAKMRPNPLLDLGNKSLDPARDRGVGDLYAAVRQHQLEIADSRQEHQLPTGCPQKSSRL
jgi:hypothetical protein